MEVRLTRQLVLENPENVPDGAGGFSENWSVLGALWADILPRTGRERGEGAATLSQMGYRIIVRGAPVGATSRPRADQRFRDGARVYRIEAVTEHDRDGRYLVCFATEEQVA